MAEKKLGIKDFGTLVSRAKALGYELYGYDRDYKTREKLKEKGRAQFSDWNNSVNQGRELYNKKNRTKYTADGKEKKGISISEYDTDLIFSRAGMFIYNGNSFEWQEEVNLDSYLKPELPTSIPVLQFSDNQTGSGVQKLGEFVKVFSDYSNYKISNTFFLYRLRNEGNKKMIYPIVPFFKKGQDPKPFTCDSIVAEKYVSLLNALAHKHGNTVDVNSSNFMKPPVLGKLSDKRVSDLLEIAGA